MKRRIAATRQGGGSRIRWEAQKELAARVRGVLPPAQFPYEKPGTDPPPGQSPF
jgi:hypothetical protein